MAGLIPDDAFFDHLANRRFPAGAFIRPERELDYLSEPDVFHDVFGHVPLLADPVYAPLSRSLWQGRPARARRRAAPQSRAALLVHGRVRLDADAEGCASSAPASCRRRGDGLFAGGHFAEPRRFRSRAHHAHEIHHQRLPADLFRHRQLRAAARGLLSGFRSALRSPP